MLRHCEPLLGHVCEFPHARLEGPDELGLIPEYYRLSREQSGPVVLACWHEDELMTIKPEDALRALAEHTADDLVVPTMTTAPAWRDLGA